MVPYAKINSPVKLDIKSQGLTFIRWDWWDQQGADNNRAVIEGYSGTVISLRKENSELEKSKKL